MKRLQFCVCPTQAILHGILWVFFVVQNAECNPMEHRSVATEYLFCRGGIPINGLLNKDPFFRNDFFPELGWVDVDRSNLPAPICRGPQTG